MKVPAAGVDPPITALSIVPPDIVGAMGDANLAVVTMPSASCWVVKGTCRLVHYQYKG